MPSTRSEPARLRLTRAAALGFALACGCTYQRCPTRPRPPLPAIPAASQSAPVLVATTTQSLTQIGPDRWRGELVAATAPGAPGGGEVVQFELWRSSSERRPLVLLVPILAGGAELMESVGRRLQDLGFDIAFCARAGGAMKPPQRGPELAALFRRTVLHQRLLLAWLREPRHQPPPATFVLGMSLGGIVATAVAALEPDLDATAICLSGGDLGSLVPASSESRVADWVDWRRHQDGVGTDHLTWELRRDLDLEPVAMAASVATGKILFVAADFDTVIPRRNRDLLWEALGRPTRLSVPLGHYSAILAIDPIVRAAAAHFLEHVPAPPATPR